MASDLPSAVEARRLVDRIATGDHSSYTELYTLLQQGVRLFFAHRFRSDENIEDLVHDVFLRAIVGIRNGALREPDRLLGYVRGIAKHVAADHMANIVRSRNYRPFVDDDRVTSHTPEALHAAEERRTLLRSVMNALPARDQDILTRFYLLEQDAQQICAEMGLTEDQYRVIKSRAKKRFVDLAHRPRFARTRAKLKLLICKHSSPDGGQ